MNKNKQENHYEFLSAKKYYGKHAVGSVVLCNGYPTYHGPTQDAIRFLKKFLRPDSYKTKAFGGKLLQRRPRKALRKKGQTASVR